MNTPRFDLSGRLALVTGSSQGIGLALARALAEHGAHIVLNGRNRDRLDEAVDALRAERVEAHPACFDVSNQEEAEAGIAGIEQQRGPVDILINNAGMQFRAPLEQFPAEKWDLLLKTNVSSVFYVSQIVARGMIGRGKGKIINIASVQSELARPTIAPYTATKGAVRNLTRAMAADWGRYGLQINAIAPGYFKTPLNQALVDDPEFTGWLERRTPAARWGEVSELAGAAIFLASDASSFVNGHTLFVDGGISVVL